MTIYSGRTEDLIQPLLDAFFEETGIEVRAKYGDSADLALLIDEEVGAGRVEADVFLSQSPGSLGFLDENGRLAMLPEDVKVSSPVGLVAPLTIPDEGLNFASVVSQLERDLILKCLEKTGGNKRQAARLLQLSRTTLIDKLHRLNVAHSAA